MFSAMQIYIYITVSSMGNFLEVGDPNFKNYSENLESTDSLIYYIALQHADTIATL